MEGLREEGEGSSQPPQSVLQQGFCAECSRCSEDATGRGFDSTLAAWAGPRDALLLQNLSGAVPLKVVVGKLRGEGFARSPSRGSGTHLLLLTERHLGLETLTLK